MIKEFSKPQTLVTTQTRCHFKNMLRYLHGKINVNSKVLDVGNHNLLTKKIKEYFKIPIYNTEGDLDNDFILPKVDYDFIIFSHTLEHLFNPLHTLNYLKCVMTPKTLMIIAIPYRPCWLRDKGHFHEMDEYLFKYLMKRAGLRIVDRKKYKIWRKWWFYFTGIRPLLRLLFEYNIIYTVKINK